MDKYVGTSLPRAGGRERVTGRLQYAADARFDGALHCRLVTLPCGRARILSIDAQAALRLPGVRCVLTPADLPRPMPRCGPVENDRPLLADGETKYHGEAVAIVAAEDEDIAAEAASLVRVDHEPLPGVYTLSDALAPSAPLVQDPGLRPDSPFRHTNIYNEWRYERGDAALREAHLVLENTFRFPMVSHFAIEPHAYIAGPDDQGGVVIWSTVQHPFLLRRVVAGCLGLPIAKVRVIALDLGGGFGGKGYPKLEALMAFLAMRVGRPVRLSLSLTESFSQSRRSGCEVSVRTGFSADGRLVFNHAEANYHIGAYADIAARFVGKTSYVGCGAYRVPNLRVVGRAIFTHTVPATAFRGFGAPQYLWALESQIDQAARRLGIDRLEIRLRNIPDRGQTLVPGDTPVDGDWAGDLRKTAEALGWGTPLPPGRGRGLAIGIKSPKPGTASQAIVRIHGDGSASVLAATVDMGQGSRTIMRQLAADALGIAPDRIHVHGADTGTAPFDAVTASSRSAVFMGNAVLDACQKLKCQLAAIAAERTGTPESSVTLADGLVHAAGRAVSYADLIEHRYGSGGGELIAVGEYRQRPDPSHPLEGLAPFWELICFGAEVEVDRRTGQYHLTRLVTVGDIGKALNPSQLHGQDEGGAIIGLGHTMMEQLVIGRDGRIANAGALDYRIPTIADIPDAAHSILVENADGPGPFGAKGTGESGVLAVAPAVASALAEATGVVFTELPITPEKVWRALQRPRASGSASADPI